VTLSTSPTEGLSLLFRDMKGYLQLRSVESAI
jgi:hypothetical protein